MKRAALLIFAAVAALLLFRAEWRGERPAPTPDAPAEDRPAEAPPPLADAPVPETVYEGDDAVRVSGSVTSRSDNRPVAGARVRMETFAGVFETVVGRDGLWALTVPQSRVEARPFGFRLRFHTTTVAAEGFVSFRANIEIPRRVKEHWLPIRLDPVGATLTVRVVDPEGRPVPRAWLSYDREWHRADETGAFGPVPLGVGSYVVRAFSEGHGPGRSEVLVLPSTPPGEREVEVVLSVPRFARGRVVDEAGDPVAGAKVRQSYHQDGPFVRTDADGRFLWPIDPDEQPAVNVSKPGYTVRRAKHELDPAAETEITLYRAAAAEGIVYRADGSPAAGVGVAVFEGWGTNTLTDERGRFRLDPLRPGTARIQVTLGEIQLGTFEREIGHGLTRLTLRLPERKLTGVVRDALSGAPLEGVRVTVVPGTVPGVSDAEGRFETPGFPVALEKEGYIPLRATAAGKAWEMAPLGRVRMRVVVDSGVSPMGIRAKWETGESRRKVPGWFRRQARADANGVIVMALPAGETVPVTVESAGRKVSLDVSVDPGKTTDLGEIRLAGSGSLRSIVVKDERGAPLAEAFVRSRWTTGRIYTADERGRIRFPGGRDRQLLLSAPGWETRVIGKEEEVNLRRSAPLRGRVLDDTGSPVFGVEVEADLLGAVTDGRGRFSCDGFPEGRAVLVEIDEGPPGCFRGIDWSWAVAGGEEVTLRVPRPGRIRFRFGDGSASPGGGAEFHLLDREFESEYAFGPKDPLVFPVPSGRLTVLFEPKGQVAKLWSEVLVEPGRETVLTYDFPKPGALTGLVTDVAGRPLAAVLTTVLGGRVVGESDEEGRIRGTGACSGTTPLRVEADGHAEIVTAPVDLRAGGHLRIELSAGGTVRGKLARPDGTNVNCRVRLRGESVRAYKGTFRFRKRVPAGRHTLEILEDGRLPVYREIEVSDGREAEISVVLPR